MPQKTKFLVVLPKKEDANRITTASERDFFLET